jgi:hypothetical protein
MRFGFEWGGWFLEQWDVDGEMLMICKQVWVSFWTRVY